MAERPAVASSNAPTLTLPMIFAFVAFGVFVLWALFPNDGRDTFAVTPAEYDELRKFTLFFIGALLPSDALIRFGRGVLFRKVDNPAQAASDAPATTVAQILAMAIFAIVACAMLVSDKWIDESEGPQIIDVARTLVVALLPSDAGIRFGRAIYLSSVGQPTSDQLRRA